MKKIKVVIVDDHLIFRNGLRQMLDQISCVGEVKDAENGEEFIELVEGFKPDVVLMDIKMPKMNGIDATKMALAIDPDIKIIALSMFDDGEYIKSMFDAGSKGYLLKNVKADELEKAIRNVCSENGYYYSSHLSSALINGFLFQLDESNHKVHTEPITVNDIELSNRAYEILQLIYKGLTSKEIAEKLNLSHRTIQGHRTRLMRQLGVKNSNELLRFAMENNLV